MIVVACSDGVMIGEVIAQQLSANLIVVQTKKFQEQEIIVQMDISLQNETVILVQSTCKAINDSLVELLIIADHIKNSGAEKIIAVIPYCFYSRQDYSYHGNDAISLRTILQLFKSVGIESIVTVDLHAENATELLAPYSIRNIESARIFANVLQHIDDCVIVSPDKGGLSRVKKLAALLSVDYAYMLKNRTGEKCYASHLIGDVHNKNCVIVDDIVCTGSTLEAAVMLLHKYKPRSISACVTHGLFTSGCLSLINALDFQNFYLTDTINNKALPKKVEILHIGHIISEILAEVMRDY